MTKFKKYDIGSIINFTSDGHGRRWTYGKFLLLFTVFFLGDGCCGSTTMRLGRIFCYLTKYVMRSVYIMHGINNEHLLQSFHTSSVSSQRVECEICVSQIETILLLSKITYTANFFTKMYRSSSVLMVRCVRFYSVLPEIGAVYCAFVLEYFLAYCVFIFLTPKKWYKLLPFQSGLLFSRFSHTKTCLLVFDLKTLLGCRGEHWQFCNGAALMLEFLLTLFHSNVNRMTLRIKFSLKLAEGVKLNKILSFIKLILVYFGRKEFLTMLLHKSFKWSKSYIIGQSQLIFRVT